MMHMCMLYTKFYGTSLSKENLEFLGVEFCRYSKINFIWSGEDWLQGTVYI